MKIKDSWIFLASTAIHTAFIGWLSYGIEYFYIFLFSTISCLLLMPLGYLASWTFYEKLNQYGILSQTRFQKNFSNFILVEVIFLMIFIITSLAIIFVTHTK